MVGYDEYHLNFRRVVCFNEDVHVVYGLFDIIVWKVEGWGRGFLEDYLLL